MRVLVTGGRDYADEGAVFATLDEMDGVVGISVLITGACHLGGADLHAENWAKERQIPYMGFPARWKDHGKKAGMVRNQAMLEITKPDIVVAFPGGNGTENCVLLAHKMNIPVREINQ